MHDEQNNEHKTQMFNIDTENNQKKIIEHYHKNQSNTKKFASFFLFVC